MFRAAINKMATIADIRKRFNALDLIEEAGAAIDQTRDQLIEKQKDQLLHGFNSKGERIGKYKSAKYARVKNQMNPLAGLGNVDLKVKGDYHGGLFVDVRTDSYVVESGDEKSGDLEKKYGKKTLGLNKDSLEEYVPNDLQPVFIKNIRKKLKL